MEVPEEIFTPNERTERKERRGETGWLVAYYVVGQMGIVLKEVI
jgi:hypothetical protein